MPKPTKESQLSKETQKRIDRHHVASAQRALAAEVIAFESLSGPVKNATYELVQHVTLAPEAGRVQAAHAGIKQASTALQANYEQAAKASLSHARRLAMLQVESEAVEAQALIKQLMGVEVDLGGLMQIMGDEALDSATASAAANSVATKWQNSKLARIASSQLQGEAASKLLQGLANNGAVQSTVDLHASTLSFGAYGAQHHKAWNELAPGSKQPLAFKRPVEPVPFPLEPRDEDSPFGSGPETGLPYGWGEAMMQIWSAILDRKTCPTCWALDGSMVPIGKDWPGAGKPPLHPRCRCIPIALFVPEALSRKLPGIQIDYDQLKADIRDYMRGSSLKLGEGARHARSYIEEALQGKSPAVLTKRLQDRRGYFPGPNNPPKPKPPKGGPILPSSAQRKAEAAKKAAEKEAAAQARARLAAERAKVKAEQAAAREKLIAESADFASKHGKTVGDFSIAKTKLAGSPVYDLVGGQHLGDGDLEIIRNGRKLTVTIKTAVGDVARYYDLDGLSVEHAYLFLNEAAQGKGLGTKIVLAQAEQYRKLGLKTVHLDAVDVGRYNWPKMGFRPPPETERKLVSGFRRWARKQGIEVPDSLETAPQIARFSAKGQKLGKEYLLKHSGMAKVNGYSATVDEILMSR